MRYDYKTIEVKSGESYKLNELYADGWEFVNSVAQHVANTGGGSSYDYGKVYGNIFYTLRKEKQDLKL